MTTPPKTYLTPEEYLEIERKAEFKSEFYRGEMYAMAGAKEGHNSIVWNATLEIGQHIRSRPCKGYSADMRVKVGETMYTYPDLVVVCGEARFLEERRDTLLNPTLVIGSYHLRRKHMIAASSSSCTARWNRSVNMYLSRRNARW